MIHLIRFQSPAALAILVFLLSPVSPAQEETEDPEFIFHSNSENALFSVVRGSWRHKEFEGRKLIRLSPEPIEECRVDLGPTLRSYDLTISAKILGKCQGRLCPRMGVGLFGKYGFTLRLAPGHGRLELVQYGEIIASETCKWQSATWHYIELQMLAATNHWILEGRTWSDEVPRLESPTFSHKAYPGTMTHPLSGKAFLTASPYNGLPIFFDEVVLRKTVVDSD